VDDSLSSAINYLSTGLLGLIGILSTTVYSVPWFAIAIIPFSLVYYCLLNYSRFTVIQLKRLTRLSMTPVYANFDETLSGLITIRAFRQVPRFLMEGQSLLQAYIMCEYASCAAAGWLSLRLQLIGTMMVGLVAFTGVTQNYIKPIDASFFGLALTYMLTSAGILSGLIVSFTEVEKEMVSVERIFRLQTGDKEEVDGGGDPCDNKWPTQANIKFVNAVLKYTPNSNNALDSISFEIESGERIAIVGRTGSGKSSVLMALFRCAELTSGSIYIDNVDISTVNLNGLRRAMAIVPQDPFLFAGTLRNSLDPLGLYDDQTIWQLLKGCQLADKIKQFDAGLETSVDNKCFSSGERQLLCLTRSLLANRKILCLDEATASVDYKTDLLIRNMIKLHAKQCTIIAVTHRLDTIQDYDKAIVLENGRIVEYDRVQTLIGNKDSKFSLLMQSLGK
jgi:ATP-binding cassette subfamily C (CFTR/MRP) protein 10